jgi:hypothetical protein
MFCKTLSCKPIKGVKQKAKSLFYHDNNSFIEPDTDIAKQ